ncbi:MAG: hypothetical protein E6J00_13470 [Chloroflexi bacterium]|nr:MAG: hypothetical protein E6J00_13470 [Chloroflexota bacterium]
MERFTRRRLIVPALLAASLAVLSALPVSAWTQEVNEFDTGGTSNCGTKQSEPCLFWQQPHYTVVTLNAYLDPSLNLNYYDFHPVLTNLIFPNYNTDPAYNPSFRACTSSVTCGPLGYSMGTAPTCGAYATTYLAWQTPWFDPNHNGGEWNAYLQTGGGSQLTLFNGAVTWNSNFDWSFKCSGFDSSR